jgi:NIMA (never in mitosis gene a)-related kinase
MDGLFKKVLKGIYPKIPSHYSEEINKMLKRLIAVNPNQRPSCDQILQLDIVLKYIKKLGLPEEGDLTA